MINQKNELIKVLKEKNYYDKDTKKNLEKITPETEFTIMAVSIVDFDELLRFKYVPEEGKIINLDAEKIKGKFTCNCENPCYKSEHTIAQFLEIVEHKGIFIVKQILI